MRRLFFDFGELLRAPTVAFDTILRTPRDGPILGISNGPYVI